MVSKREIVRPWKVSHLELSMALPAPAPAPMPCNRDVQGLYVVFLDAGIPLGQTIIPTNQLPLSASQLECQAFAMC